MAEQVSQIKVEIDTEEAQAKLNQLYETQAKLVGEMSKVEEGSEAYKGLGDSLEETNRQIGSIESNISKQKMGLNELDDVTNAASISVTNLGLAETTLGKVINSVADMVGKIKTATNAYTRAQEAANMAVNSGTKATKGLNTAMKGNILISVITLALPLILKLVDKLKETGKETLTLADRIDMLNTRYERLQNILSKLGAGEITTLVVEQRGLNDEIEATRTEYVNMMNKGEEVTEKMWKDLEILEGKYEDLRLQIKYLNEDQERTNKVLEEQADLDKRISQNTNALNTAKARLEIEKERNGYSERYFDILEDTERLEEEGYGLQEKSLDNKKKAIDDEFVAYQDRINASKGLTGEEKQQAIANRAKTAELEKQAIDNQKITLESQKQLNILDRQLKQIQLVKQAAQQYANFMISVSEKTAEYNSRNIGDYRQMGDFYTFQNDVLRRSEEEIQKTMSLMSGSTNSKTVSQFLKNYEALLKTWEEIDSGKTDRKVGKEEKKEIEERIKLYQGIFETYSQQVKDLLTHLEANVNNTLQATQSANDALITLYRNNLADEADYGGQSEQFNKNIEKIMKVREMLKKEATGGSLSTEEIGWLDDNGLKSLHDSYKAAGDAGIQLLDDYTNRIMNMQFELHDACAAAIVDMSQATVEFMSNAVIIGTANLSEYLESQLNAIDDLQNQEEVALDSEYDRLVKINDARRQAGLKEIDVETWKQEKLLEIQNKYDQQRKLTQRDMYMTMLQQGNDFVQNMSSVFADLYDGNKDVQKATIVVSTFANAAMAFGSTFAQSPGGFAAKAIQAAAASAAVLASGRKAWLQVDSANKEATLSGGGGTSSAAPQTGTSAVSSTIIERQIQPVRTTSSNETVLVLSDVEAKQRQQQNVNRVSVI